MLVRVDELRLMSGMRFGPAKAILAQPLCAPLGVMMVAAVPALRAPRRSVGVAGECPVTPNSNDIAAKQEKSACDCVPPLSSRLKMRSSIGSPPAGALGPPGRLKRGGARARGAGELRR